MIFAIRRTDTGLWQPSYKGTVAWTDKLSDAYFYDSQKAAEYVIEVHLKTVKQYLEVVPLKVVGQ